MTREERFWKRVDSSGGRDACWPWTGFVAPNGYGKCSVANVTKSAHRVAAAYAFDRADLLTGTSKGATGTCVCHKCDLRVCCNPNHLWLGSQADNVRDMQNKGRGFAPGPRSPRRGEEHHRSKLSNAAVVLILQRTATANELADQFGVTAHHVRNIWRKHGR